MIGISERPLRRRRKRYEMSRYDGLLNRQRGVSDKSSLWSALSAE